MSHGSFNLQEEFKPRLRKAILTINMTLINNTDAKLKKLCVN